MTEPQGTRHSAPEGRIRPVSTADIPALVAVCRGCFPLSLRWQGLRTVAEHWWRAVVATPAAETSVFECGGVVHGFCVLVTDAKLWADQKACRRASLLPAVLSMFACPAVAMAKIRGKCAAARRPDPGPVEQRDSPERSARAWIELIAVGPDMRGRGVARRLLEACEAKTAELGGEAIGLSVDVGNDPAIRLYEVSGYVRTYATRFRCVYMKTLSVQKHRVEPSADAASRRINLGNPA